MERGRIWWLLGRVFRNGFRWCRLLLGRCLGRGRVFLGGRLRRRRGDGFRLARGFRGLRLALGLAIAPARRAVAATALAAQSGKMHFQKHGRELAGG